MQEVSVSTPQGQADWVVKLALAQGIDEATVIATRVYREGQTKEGEEVRVEVSAPESTQFIEAVMSADRFDPREYSVVSDEVVAIISQEPPERVSRPIKLSAVTVLQDLWVQNHITSAFIARATVSTILVAYGLLSGDMTIYIVALLFTPFMAQVMAVGFGGWMGDWKLARQGLKVLALSTLISILAGVLVAGVVGGPMAYDEFGTVQSNFVVSLIVGVVAGLDMADEAGRRELVAVAGAAQFASFPVWLGIALVLGFPDAQTTMWRIVTFFVNIITMLVVTVAIYMALRYRRETVRRYVAASRGQA